MRRPAVIACGFGCLLVLAANAAAGQERFVFMGDSLVDNQNSFIFTDRLNAAGVALSVTPLSPPYFEGRFSNGLNWTDLTAPNQVFYGDLYLNSPDCLTDNATIAGSGICGQTPDPGPQPDASLGFAFGGSESGNDGVLDPGAPGFLNVLQDLEDYVAAGRVADPAGAVFAVWTGGNDYSAFAVDSGGLTTAEAVDATLDNIEDGLGRIAALGASRAVVLNIFDLSRVPTFVDELGAAGAAIAEDAANLHNTLLPARLANVRAATGLDTVLVDAAGLYDDIFADPARYGFVNVTEGCISDDGVGTPTGACPTAAEEATTLYWDGTHPTATAHAHIADLFQATLATVDRDAGRIAALADSGLTRAEATLGKVRSQIDQWRADTADAPAVRAAQPARRQGGPDVFVVAAGDYGAREARDGFAGYDYAAHGGLVGLNYHFDAGGRSAIAGAHVGAQDLDADVNGGGAFDVSAYSIGLHGGVRSGAFTLSAAATALWLDYDKIERPTGFAPRPTANGETDGWAFAGEIEGRFEFTPDMGGQDVWLAPLARLSAARADVDSFMESDAAFLNLSVADSDLTRVRGALGFDAWTRFDLESGAVTPFASIAWERDLDELDWRVDAALPSGQAVRGHYDGGAQDRVALDLGVAVDMAPGVRLEAAVAAAFGGTGGHFIAPRLGLRAAF